MMDHLKSITDGIYNLVEHSEIPTENNFNYPADNSTYIQVFNSDYAQPANTPIKHIMTIDNGKEVYIDETNCKTFSVQSTQKVTASEFENHQITSNTSQQLISDFYISYVNRYILDKGFKNSYLLKVGIVLANGPFVFYLKQDEYENKAIVKAMRHHNLAGLIRCSDSEANQIFYLHISGIIYNTQTLIPFRTGFYLYPENRYYFISGSNPPAEKSDAIEGKKFPWVQKSPIETVSRFISETLSESYQLTLAVTLHYTAMLTSILKSYGIRFDKIVVSNSDYNTTRAILDIYGNLQYNTLISSGEAETKLKPKIFYLRDDILYIGNNISQKLSHSRIYDRINNNVEFLINTFCKGMYFDANEKIKNITADCLCVMTKGYATDILPDEYIFPLELPDTSSYSSNELRDIIHDIDMNFANWVYINTQFIGDVCSKYSQYGQNTNKAALSCVFEIMSTFFSGIAPFNINISDFTKYIESLSDFINDDSLISQVTDVISSLVINDEIEIVHADKLYQTMSRTSAPTVYYKNNMLYFETALFNEKIADKIGGVTSCLALKKKLLEKGFLDCDNENEYNTRKKLPGTEDQKRYTAVSMKLLNEKAFEKVPPEYSSFLPCQNNDGNVRIRLGYDSRNRGVYWSINHPDMINQTMLVVGSSGCGKSSFVFKLAKSASEAGDCIIYIDYNNSCTRKEFTKFGVDNEWIDSNIRYIDSEKWDAESDTLLYNAHVGNGRKIIVINVIDEDGSELSLQEKSQEIDILLDYILNWCKENKDISRIRVIIDEVNNSKLEQESIINTIITQYRKSGISLIMITPNISGLKLQQRNTLEAASTKVIFRQDTRSAQKLFATHCTYNSKDAFEKHLSQLGKFVFCLTGNLEDYDGNMKKESIQIHIDTN